MRFQRKSDALAAASENLMDYGMSSALKSVCFIQFSDHRSVRKTVMETDEQMLFSCADLPSAISVQTRSSRIVDTTLLPPNTLNGVCTSSLLHDD
jgi:hypothetical protein